MIENPTEFVAENGEKVNLLEVDEEDLETYVKNPEDRLSLLTDRQRSDYETAMAKRLVRQERARNGQPDFD